MNKVPLTACYLLVVLGLPPPAVSFGQEIVYRKVLADGTTAEVVAERCKPAPLTAEERKQGWVLTKPDSDVEVLTLFVRLPKSEVSQKVWESQMGFDKEEDRKDNEHRVLDVVSDGDDVIVLFSNRSVCCSIVSMAQRDKPTLTLDVSVRSLCFNSGFFSRKRIQCGRILPVSRSLFVLLDLGSDGLEFWEMPRRGAREFKLVWERAADKDANEPARDGGHGGQPPGTR